MHILVSTTSVAVIAVVSAVAVIAILVSVLIVLNSKRKMPSKTIIVDITGNKLNNANDALDYYLIKYGKGSILSHIETINEWKDNQLAKAKGNAKKEEKLKRHWAKQERFVFFFQFTRIKTRYKQVNYKRHSYKVQEVAMEFSASPSVLLNRIMFLEKTGHLVTLNQFNSSDQRKAMTKELREYIKKRDNYTCQICGKYMPDEVGLHIDHIIPVAKGGKSVPDNLRVLCSKCNGKKGAK